MDKCINKTSEINETLGIDIGDRYSEVCIVDSAGVRRQRVRTERASMQEFLQRPRAHVVFEVGGHSRWLSQLCKEAGHKVTVANPRAVKLITQARRKSDKKDAELLARLGQADARLLYPVVHRSDEAQAKLAVLKAREQLVSTRTALMLHIRGVLKSFAIRVPRSSGGSFLRQVREKMPEALAPALEPICATIEQLNEQIKQYDKRIEELGKAHPCVAAMKQICGVGTLTALAMALTLDEAGRFRRSRDVGAYLGLVPRRSQSGEVDLQMRISKAGDPFARKLLVQAANYILGPFGKPCDLRDYGMRVAARGGKRPHQRAKIAVARKLAVLMHRLWVTGEVYQPTGYSDSAAQAA